MNIIDHFDVYLIVKTRISITIVRLQILSQNQVARILVYIHFLYMNFSYRYIFVPNKTTLKNNVISGRD